MQKAKAFLFVSLGVLALAAAYGLGADHSAAQSFAPWDCYMVNSAYSAATVCSNRIVTWYGWNSQGSPDVVQNVVPVPGSARVIAADLGIALLEDGEVYVSPMARNAGNSFPWRLSTVIPSGATPAIQKSWGQVKVDHVSPAPTPAH